MVENTEKEYIIFEASDRSFKIRRDLFLEQIINWQLELKDGSGDLMKIRVVNIDNNGMQKLKDSVRALVKKPACGYLEFAGKTADQISNENLNKMTSRMYGDRMYRFLKVHNQTLMKHEDITVMFEIICQKADDNRAQLCMVLKAWQGRKLLRELRLKEFLFTALVLKLEDSMIL